MATKKVHGTTLQTYDTGSYVFSLMSDGIVLRQWRYNGRLEAPTIETRRFKGNAQDALARLLVRDGLLRVRRNPEQAYQSAREEYREREEQRERLGIGR